MSVAAELLKALRDRGVSLVVDGSQLRYRAPRGAFTDELRAAIAQHRPEVLRLLVADEWLAATLQRISDQHDRIQPGCPVDTPEWERSEAVVNAAYHSQSMTALRDALDSYERHAQAAFDDWHAGQ